MSNSIPVLMLKRKKKVKKVRIMSLIPPPFGALASPQKFNVAFNSPSV